MLQQVPNVVIKDKPGDGDKWAVTPFRTMATTNIELSGRRLRESRLKLGSPHRQRMKPLMQPAIKKAHGLVTQIIGVVEE